MQLFETVPELVVSEQVHEEHSETPHVRSAAFGRLVYPDAVLESEVRMVALRGSLGPLWRQRHGGVVRVACLGVLGVDGLHV